MKKIAVTIIIPTRNAGKELRPVLDKIFKQDFNSFELIIIDSESTDGTVDLIKKYPAKLIQIKTTEFGHGRTRNYGASMAKGRFVVFLTQDSQPYDKNWLSNLIAPFEDKKIVGVFGRQIPKENENILDKLFFTSLYGSKSKIWNKNNSAAGDNVFSDANSALRKDVLLKNPYMDDIIVSEDYEWAFRMFQKGYKIFYSTKANVIHSHSYNLYTLFKRNFDIGVSYKDIYSPRTGGSLKFLKKGLGIYKEEINLLIRHKKTHLIPNATIRDFIRLFAITLGKKEQYFSKEIKKKYLSGQRWYWV